LPSPCQDDDVHIGYEFLQFLLHDLVMGSGVASSNRLKGALAEYTDLAILPLVIFVSPGQQQFLHTTAFRVLLREAIQIDPSEFRGGLVITWDLNLNDQFTIESFARKAAN
jgi:hypothetical protein